MGARQETGRSVSYYAQLRQTVSGTNLVTIEANAQAAVVAFFGSTQGVTWSLDVETHQTLGGQVLGYAGTVYAKKLTDDEVD